MSTWAILLDILLLLSAATVFGVVCAWLRQSPIIGYLAAGTLLGPNALSLVSAGDEVAMLAELGIALLLFTIGLEFSWHRLTRLGRSAIGGGLLQVGLTLAVGAGAAILLGQGWRTAIVLGAVLALSSTACVLRLLVARAEIESVHGRHALGILLVQDAAVVPLVLLVSIVSGDGGLADAGWSLLRVLLGAAVLVGLLYLLLTRVVPPLLRVDALRQARDLPVLVAIVVGLGAAWGSHELGLSPALGAFVAGMLLAASPFATQVRADVGSLRTLLVTLFFSSIGMLGDPAWLLEHVGLVLVAVVVVVVGKALIVWLVLRLLGLAHESALATGLCLAQVGEFSFILAGSAHGDLIDEDLLRLIVSATIISLFLTPYVVATAPRLAARLVAPLRGIGLVRAARPASSPAPVGPARRVILVGFGPAGRVVGQLLAERGDDVEVVVLELNPRAVDEARGLGFHAEVGDATHADVLGHAGLLRADTVVVTVPDPSVVVRIVELARATAPDVFIIARARYHLYAEEIRASGADEIVDEESLTGTRMAAHLRRHLGAPEAPGAPED